MNQLHIKGEWHELIAKFSQKLAEPSDDYLSHVEGQDKEMLGDLQKRLGKTQQEIPE